MRRHPRSGFILQDSNTPGLYDGISAISSHCTEGNYIRPGRTMVFWKLICSIWASKNDCCECRWIFCLNFQRELPRNFTNPVICSCNRQPQGNYKLRV